MINIPKGIVPAASNLGRVDLLLDRHEVCNDHLDFWTLHIYSPNLQLVNDLLYVLHSLNDVVFYPLEGELTLCFEWVTLIGDEAFVVLEVYLELTLDEVNRPLVLPNYSLEENSRDFDHGLGESWLELMLVDGLVHHVEYFIKPLILFFVALNSELVFLLEEISLIGVVVVAQSNIHFTGLSENKLPENRQFDRRHRDGPSFEIDVFVDDLKVFFLSDFL